MAPSLPNNPKTVPHIAALPGELLSSISARLGCEDVCSLRLTSKDIMVQTLHEFATEYFSEKCFMITAESLKVLVGVANNARLRKYLHSVYIITAAFEENATQCQNGCKRAWQPTVRQFEAFTTYSLDQQHLKQTGEDKRMLAEAFGKLPSLKKLKLVDNYHVVDPTVDIRGRYKVPRTTGRAPMFPLISGDPTAYTSWKTHVWRIMLEALANSGSTSIESFGGNFTKIRSALSVRDDLSLQDDQIRAGLRNALHNLKTVVLSLKAPVLGDHGSMSDEVVLHSRIMKEFAEVMSSLENLDLTYEGVPTTGALHHSFFTMLDGSRLTTLAIEGLHIHANLFAATLTALPVIKDLRVSWVNLTRGKWTAVLRALKKLTTLEHLHLMWLREKGQKAFFLKQPEAEDEWVDDNETPGLTHEGHDDSAPSAAPLGSFANPVQLPPAHVTGSMHDVPCVSHRRDQRHHVPDTDEEADEFKAPEYACLPERGYHICLQSAERIHKYLPIFIKEYNAGENTQNDIITDIPFPFPPLPLPGGPGAPPANEGEIMSSFFQALFGYPLPAPPGGVSSAGVATAGASVTTAASAATSAVADESLAGSGGGGGPPDAVSGIEASEGASASITDSGGDGWMFEDPEEELTESEDDSAE